MKRTSQNIHLHVLFLLFSFQKCSDNLHNYTVQTFLKIYPCMHGGHSIYLFSEEEIIGPSVANILYMHREALL